MKFLINCLFFTLIIIFIKKVINTDNKYKYIKLVLILIIVWGIMFCVDYLLVRNQQLPLFCWKFFGIFSYQDGGTVEYIGIGYKVIDFHAIIYNPYKGIMEYKYERIHMCPWWMAYDELLDKYVYNSY